MKKHIIRYTFALALMVAVALPQAAVFAQTIDANGVLAFTNAQRYRAGLPFLTSNTLLSQAALLKMQDLFAKQYFAHESPTGQTVSDVAKGVGYSFITVGENLALGDFYSNKHVVDSWMGSPGHKANILSPRYSEIGIAAGRSMYNGRYTWIVVQAFGLPKSACPGVDTDTKAQIDALDARLKTLLVIVEMRKKLIDEKGISRTEYVKRVESYNVAVNVYNAVLEKEKKLVAEYNEGVDEYNGCLETKLATDGTETH